MQSSESLSSGFIGSDFPEEEPMYTDIKPFFTSKNGYSQLYSCRIHGKIHILKGLKPLYRNQKLFRQLLIVKIHAIKYNICVKYQKFVGFVMAFHGKIRYNKTRRKAFCLRRTGCYALRFFRPLGRYTVSP